MPFMATTNTQKQSTIEHNRLGGNTHSAVAAEQLQMIELARILCLDESACFNSAPSVGRAGTAGRCRHLALQCLEDILSRASVLWLRGQTLLFGHDCATRK